MEFLIGEISFKMLIAESKLFRKPASEVTVRVGLSNFYRKLIALPICSLCGGDAISRLVSLDVGVSLSFCWLDALPVFAVPFGFQCIRLRMKSRLLLVVRHVTRFLVCRIVRV